METINKIGRRKTSVARIYLTSGKGNVTVNDRDLKEYFPNEILQTTVNQPFALTNNLGKYDVNVNVQGGGIRGQAEAVRLAITRALIEISEDSRQPLKKEGLTTRDPRMVERKKYGRRKARRRFQFSKR
ncbi:MAG: 30S ribosomal protein S9 [Sporocytophaga sp.]|jgi:small subunit ribosomal protein S9|uniref:30S ribosomal protein S9 n=1 Tax=Sporocytophaga myxococcoides TaxID=153721 RepID=UPI0004065A5D|nr:30S ribosomal protein S9 [Sporocytophaga myxococcoides]MCR6638517.1 30S ribosomal protein S9 [Sporocytophaga sp.]